MQEPGSSPRRPATPSGHGHVRAFAWAFYLVLLLVGLLWCYARTGRWLPESLAGGDTWMSLALGTGTAAIVILVSLALVRRIASMRWFAEEIRRLLGPIDTGTALHLALASGIAEEVFFRGAVQPVLGYVGTSLAFGLIHIGPDRRFLSWTLFAVAMGFALGGMLELTGSLAGPVIAHVGVNFVNLRHIGRLPTEHEGPDQVTTFGDHPDPD